MSEVLQDMPTRALLFLIISSCGSGSSSAGFSATADTGVRSGSAAAGKPTRSRPCPSLPQRTSASFLFKPGLAGPGVFDLEVMVDGERETCAVTLGSPHPAVRGEGVVIMGRQEQSSTCKLVTLGGTFSDGSLAGLEREGDARELRVKISEKGKVIAEGTFKPDYAPDECGQRTRHQELAVTR